MAAWAQRTPIGARVLNLAGRSPSAAIWRDAGRAAVAAQRGLSAVAVLSDIQRCLENVDWRVVLDSGNTLRYTSATLRLSVVSYSVGRSLLLGRLPSPTPFPRKGIAAGSAFAAFELAKALLPRFSRGGELTTWH